jgi:RIO-like serine/threonine protein kinase
MEINFWKPTTSAGVIKATIHKSGKLGFSQAAIDKLELSQNTYLMVGTNKENKKDSSIYLAISRESNEMAIKVNKAGNYYYLSTKDFFNEIGVDFKNKSIIYDIVDISTESEKLYKLIPREKDRKKK